MNQSMNTVLLRIGTFGNVARISMLKDYNRGFFFNLKMSEKIKTIETRRITSDVICKMLFSRKTSFIDGAIPINSKVLNDKFSS